MLFLTSTNDKKMIKSEIEEKLRRVFGKTLQDATIKQVYQAVAITVRDQIMEKWMRTEAERKNIKSKSLYYMSFEFLVGRSFTNNLLNLSLIDIYRDVMKELGYSLETLEEVETDAALGNGGLGRLASCFMDTLATQNYSAYGCGIRYEYGLFKQKIIDGYQIEMPDPWLEDACLWEIERPEEQVEINFGGHVESFCDDDGRLCFKVVDASTVLGIPYDMPICGYKTDAINTLRLWSARSPKKIDMNLFSHGEYAKAMEERELAEVLSKVLYPEDDHFEGKNLRLKQQYFFTSATMQWILRSLKEKGIAISKMTEHVQIQINDTHPGIAIPELMRLLIDQEGMEWDEAWAIVKGIFAYTNHTILFEALEKWPTSIMEAQTPRVYMIIEEINRRQQEDLSNYFPNDWGKINHMSIINDGYINIANMCLYTCHAVNGVSKLHTDILREDVFNDYNKIYPYKFYNVTNGITHRRWLCLANPKLSRLIENAIGDKFHLDPERLRALTSYAKDSAFGEEIAKIRRENKVAFAKYISQANGVKIDPDSLFDTHIKRLHEYKRQLLNILHIQHLYNQLKENPNMDMQPRTFIFGAKASPGYHRAKLIIKLINSVASNINNDLVAQDKIKIVFIENYGVSLAQKIIPATDLSEQISTAGKEASGTGNMKFMLNGALTIGTLDGANIEMVEKVGYDNMYVFGMRKEEVITTIRAGNHESQNIYNSNPAVKLVIDQLINGTFDVDKPNLFNDLYYALLFGDQNVPDPYMVIGDFVSYTKTQEQVSEDYRDSKQWYSKAIINIAESGYFSSDRTITEYNDSIWHLR